MNTYRIYSPTGVLLGHVNAYTPFYAILDAGDLFGVKIGRAEFHSKLS